MGPKCSDRFKRAKQEEASETWSLKKVETIAAVRGAILSYFGLGFSGSTRPLAIDAGT